MRKTRLTIRNCGRIENQEIKLDKIDDIETPFAEEISIVNRTKEIADKCNLVFDMQEKEICKFDENKLKQEIYEGLENRGLSYTSEIKKRIELEWGTFKKNGQLNYVNFFKELCAFAKSNNISIGSGRGPVCASLILYALNISDINPLNYGLLFERIPKKLDIDIDVEPSGKTLLIKYLKQRYGERNVLGTLWGNKHAFLRFGKHAGKLVIKGDNDVLPIINIEGSEVVAYGPEEIKYLGLFDLDLLELKVLTNIKDTLSLVKERYGVDIKFNPNSSEDERAFSLINSLNTENVFEFENERSKDLIKKYTVKNLNDLSMIIALNRPFTEDITVIRDEELKGILNPYLTETKDMLIYQEQLMNILHDLTGFSYEEADGARKQIAKRKRDNNPDYKTLFMERAIEKFGVKQSNKIWDYLYDNGKYCFLKAHSIPYAFMSYQTAFLKANYRKEFDEIFSKESK